MKYHKLIATIIILVISLITAGCYNNFKTNPVNNIVTSIEYNFLGNLSQDNLLNDYEFLWKNLLDGYPFLGVVERNGVDVNDVYDTYKTKLQSIENDYQVIGFYEMMFSALGNVSHLAIVSDSEAYFYLDKLFESSAKDFGDEAPHALVLNDIISNRNSNTCYNNLSELQGSLNATEKDTVPVEQSDVNNPSPTDSEIAAMSAIDDNIAYVQIIGFGEESRTGDYKRLLEFFTNNQDISNLIIDIRGNGGGSSKYWKDNIVSLLISEPITHSTYALYNSQAEYNAEYIKAVRNYGTNKSISELPELPNLQSTDIVNLDNFIEIQEVIEPSRNSINFEGKIWLLIDNANVSSSEAFIQFSSYSDFATTVGVESGGDSGGVDPIYLALPNSGLLIRYHMFYTLNADGSSSTEYGTLPDILGDNQDALTVCLEKISKK